jgi:hypothetical protein
MIKISVSFQVPQGRLRFFKSGDSVMSQHPETSIKIPKKLLFLQPDKESKQNPPELPSLDGIRFLKERLRREDIYDDDER